jgi:hypothetical protein
MMELQISMDEMQHKITNIELTENQIEDAIRIVSPSSNRSLPEKEKSGDAMVAIAEHGLMSEMQTQLFEELIQTALEEAVLYPLRESAWDAAMLIGMPLSLSLVDSGMLTLAVVVQAAMQTTFCYVVVILVKENIEDLDKKSPNDIECYLQLISFRDYMESSLGPLLSCLVVMIWALWVLKELRRMADFFLAVWNLPRGRHTLIGMAQKKGKLSIEAIGTFRLFMMNLNLAIQFAVAFSLLILGALWLASTTVLPDLLLNSVALQFIMEIDELVYHVLCSGKIKATVRSLEPLYLPKNIVIPHRIPVRSLSSLILWLGFVFIVLMGFLNPWFGQISEGIDAGAVTGCQLVSTNMSASTS